MRQSIYLLGITLSTAVSPAAFGVGALAPRYAYDEDVDFIDALPARALQDPVLVEYAEMLQKRQPQPTGGSSEDLKGKRPANVEAGPSQPKKKKQKNTLEMGPPENCHLGFPTMPRGEQPLAAKYLIEKRDIVVTYYSPIQQRELMEWFHRDGNWIMGQEDIKVAKGGTAMIFKHPRPEMIIRPSTYIDSEDEEEQEHNWLEQTIVWWCRTCNRYKSSSTIPSKPKAGENPWKYLLEGDSTIVPRPAGAGEHDDYGPGMA